MQARTTLVASGRPLRNNSPHARAGCPSATLRPLRVTPQHCACWRRVIVGCLALVAVCAQAQSDVVGEVSKYFAEAPKQVGYEDYASLLAPAMLLSHGDWEVRAPESPSMRSADTQGYC